MQNTLIKIAWGIIEKLVTERFASRMLVILLRNISENTENKIDDEMTESIDEALGRPCG